MCELYYSVRVRSAVVVYALDGGVLLWRWGSELDGIERWSYSRLWLQPATVFLKITVSGPSRSIADKATRDQAAQLVLKRVSVVQAV